MEKLTRLDSVLEVRRLAAQKYQPEKIRLLLVAEAPPRAEDRYFYFESVDKQDSLFRYVVRCVLNIEPTREGKAEYLSALKEMGIFLIDLVQDPLGPKDKLIDAADLNSLTSRCKTLQPEAIVLVKTTVYDVAFDSLRSVGLPVVDERIPFPGSGQQLRFVSAFTSALEKIGIR
ncbi:MAG: hypothetical protein UX41_C0015G0002 [Candidatus Collierbacteria bacterium GW2011_GWE1_46_18]|uniref:Uncharacterized protein n=1 Tax=Candidatus Collierbacteria bacterium GW2011_GWE1_46_18 TaxID=1618399 RepID=A0A0G1RHR6_9BACT|nr:MAG: hypothetical protein UX41_C0015G0002 [Candidatus Collierbacteria bacterium GW2011_GWE1_46_18]